MAKANKAPVKKEPLQKQPDKIVMIRNGAEFKIDPKLLQDFINAGWRKK